MCAPAAIGAGLTGASALMNVQAQRAQAKAQQEQIARNKEFAGYQAANARQREAEDLGALRRQGHAIRAAALTAIAANGISTTYGSAADALATTDMNLAADETRLKNNAAMSAWGMQTQIEQAGAAAAQIGYQSRLAQTGTFLGAAGQMAQMGGQAYAQYTAQNGGT